MSTRSYIKQCLMDGMTYRETREETGCDLSYIGRVAAELRDKGIPVNAKSSAEARSGKIKSMRMGTVGQILDTLTDDQIAKLHAKSTVSWAEAISRVIKVRP